MYKEKITLRESIQGDKNEELKRVTLVLPKFGEYEKAFIEADGNEERFVDLVITICSGLSQKEIERLKRPDFNTIELWVRERSTKQAEYFFALEGEELEKDSPKLLQPLKGLKQVNLSTPSVKASRMMGKIEPTKDNPYAQSKYIVKACSELMDNQIEELSMPDWNQLISRLDDFLNQASDFFQ